MTSLSYLGSTGSLATGPLATGSLATVSTAELTIRMVVGLMVVGLLLFILHRIGRRVMDGRAAARPSITIRHQQRLDRHASVTLLSAGGRNLLIGTSNQSIVLLAEGDDLAGTDQAAASSTGSASTGTGSTIDVRTRGKGNPIRSLQNKTVRRP